MKQHIKTVKKETFTTPSDRFVLILFLCVLLACCFACSPRYGCPSKSVGQEPKGRFKADNTSFINSGLAPVASQSFQLSLL